MYFNSIIIIINIIFNLYISVLGIKCSKGKTIKDLPVVVTLLNIISILLGLVGLYIHKTIFTIIYTFINLILLPMSLFGFDSC